MNLRQCIDRVDELKPNQFSDEIKVSWLNELDMNIYNDIILTHENPNDELLPFFTPYTVDTMTRELIAIPPYDALYVAYLEMMIDQKNGDTDRYNNSVIIYNSHMTNYANYYNRTYMPKSKECFRLY